MDTGSVKALRGLSSALRCGQWQRNKGAAELYTDECDRPYCRKQ